MLNNEQRVHTLSSIFRQFLQENFMLKLGQIINESSFEENLDKIIKSCEQNFLQIVQQNIQKVKHQNQQLKDIMQQLKKQKGIIFGLRSQIPNQQKYQKQQNQNSKSNHINTKIQSIFLNKTKVFPTFNHISEQNKKINQSYSNWEEYITQLQLQIKHRTILQIDLKQKLNDQKQQIINLNQKNLEIQVKYRQAENRTQNIAHQLKRKIQQLNNKKKNTEKIQQSLSGLHEESIQYKKEYQNLIQQKTENQVKTQKCLNRIKILKEQNQYLREIIIKNKNNLSKLEKEKFHQETENNSNIFKILQIQNSLKFTQQIHKHQIEEYNRLNTKNQIQIKQLKHKNQNILTQNQALKMNCQNLKLEKQIVQQLLLDFKQKNQFDLQNVEANNAYKEHQIKRQHQDQIQLTKKQIQSMEMILKELRSQLSVKEDRQKYYQIYLQEIENLKKKLTSLQQTPKQPLKFNHQQNMANELIQITKSIKTLKKYLGDLIKYLKNQISFMFEYVSRSICQTIFTILDKKMFCEYCTHRKTIKIENIGDLQNEQRPQREKIKLKYMNKTIKQVSKKYAYIEQQNINFTNRLDQLFSSKKP